MAPHDRPLVSDEHGSTDQQDASLFNGKRYTGAQIANRFAIAGKGVQGATGYALKNPVCTFSSQEKAKSAQHMIGKHKLICMRYMKDSGAIDASDVLKMTTACMAQCNVNETVACMNRLNETGIQPNLFIFNALLSACAKERKVDHARHYWKAMEIVGIDGDAITYTAMMSALGKSGQAAEALTLYESMQDKKIRPTAATYTTLISVYEQLGRLDEAMTFFEEQNWEGGVLDIMPCSAMIAALGRAGRLDDALAFFDRVKDKVGNSKGRATLFSVIISICGKAGQRDTVTALLEEMDPASDELTLIERNAVITGCGNAGLVDKAMAFFQGMQNGKVGPDIISYNAIIAACEKANETQKVCSLYAEMGAANVVPDVITYSTVISALAKAGQVEKEQEVLWSAIMQGAFRANLGYHPKRNLVDFHINSIFARPVACKHEPGVKTEVAMAIVRFLHAQKRIGAGTSFIVGWHGKNILKNAIVKWIEDHGMIPVTGEPDGSPNEGRLTAMRPPVVLKPSVPNAPVLTSLNVHAKPFFPSSRKTAL